jgi:ABC-type multidrug transport system fused ATPase/permease subunit
MTLSIFRTYSSYFNKTALGRIISRYTNDLNNLDSGIFLVLIDVFERLISSIIMLVNICQIIPYFIITALILVIVIIFWYLLFKNALIITK